MSMVDISLAIHTDAPIMALTHMVGIDGFVEIGRAVRDHGPDCFEGWAEVQDTPKCRPHHIVWGGDNDAMQWLAGMLVGLGYDVVVTVPMADDQYGDHEEVTEGIAMRYTQTHTH